MLATVPLTARPPCRARRLTVLVANRCGQSCARAARGRNEVACTIECFETTSGPPCGLEDVVKLSTRFKFSCTSCGLGVFSDHILFVYHQCGPLPRPATGGGCCPAISVRMSVLPVACTGLCIFSLPPTTTSTTTSAWLQQSACKALERPHSHEGVHDVVRDLRPRPLVPGYDVHQQRDQLRLDLPCREEERDGKLRS